MQVWVTSSFTMRELPSCFQVRVPRTTTDGSPNSEGVTRYDRLNHSNELRKGNFLEKSIQMKILIFGWKQKNIEMQVQKR